MNDQNYKFFKFIISPDLRGRRWEWELDFRLSQFGEDCIITSPYFYSIEEVELDFRNFLKSFKTAKPKITKASKWHFELMRQDHYGNNIDYCFTFYADRFTKNQAQEQFKKHRETILKEFGDFKEIRMGRCVWEVGWSAHD